MRRSPQPERGLTRPASRAAAILSVAVLLGGGLAACGKDGPAETLDGFLAAWKGGKPADAMKLFEQLRDDKAAPSGIKQRASLMAELIRGSGAAS